MKTRLKDDLISYDKLELWIKEKYNVLFEGRHGVGKTHIILKAFKRANLRYAYFSGATMDPFIDFCGIPITVVDPKSGKTTIKLQRPEHLVKINPQAIFFDEFNRTHKKIRNAVMELMQFKTINGQPMGDDLQMIWAAVNPDDDESEYDVDKIDPAQADRFHIRIQIPYKCSVSYFERKYGEEGKTAVQFWNKLEEPIRLQVSPRRLDYVMRVWARGGDIRDALPVAANPSRLLQLLNSDGYEEIKPLLKDFEKAEEFFKSESNFALYIDEVIKDKKFWPLFDAMPDEKIASLLSKKKRVAKSIRTHIESEFRKKSKDAIAIYKPILNDIIQAGTNQPMVNWSRDILAIENPPAPGKATNLRDLMANHFLKEFNSGNPVSVKDLKHEIFAVTGHQMRSLTIVRKVQMYKAWFKKRHNFKLVLQKLGGPGSVTEWLVQ